MNELSRPAISRVLLLVLGALALCCAPARAEDWKAEWDRTVAAAKQEGNLVLNLLPSPAFRTIFLAEWRTEFPEIKLSISSLFAPQFVPRVKTEVQGGKYLWDVQLNGPTGGFPLARAGLLAPMRDAFILPDLKDPATWGGWDQAFVDEDKKYVLRSQWFLKMPFYNAKVLSPEKVERLGAKVLFEPELKSKIVWQDPNSGGAGGAFGYALKNMFGLDGVKRLIHDQQVVFTENGTQLVERLVRGQATVVMGPTVNSRLPQYENAGIELDVRGFGNEPRMLAFESTGGFGISIFKQPPNPNAAKVFVNWVLSKPMQDKVAKELEQISGRLDVATALPPYLTPKPGTSYLDTSSELAEARIAEVQGEIAKIRAK